MPTAELGAPANRKFDMEAWMPAKQFWGEVWNIVTISNSLCPKIIHAVMSVLYKLTWSDIIKTFFMLNSTVHEINRAHKG